MLGNSWDKSDAKSISKRMLEKVKPDESLSKKITMAQREFEIRIKQLDVTSGKLQKMHDAIFQKVMFAQRNNKISYARTYAQELAQVRKMLNMVNTAKLSLEQVKIRLDTVTEFGDVVVTLSPCMSLIRGLAPSISGIMPQASSSMSDLSQMLGDVMSGSTMGKVDTEAGLGASNDEALAILEEAHNVMVGDAQSAFPDVPTSVSSQKHVDTSNLRVSVPSLASLPSLPTQPQPQQQQQPTKTEVTSQIPSQPLEQPVQPQRIEKQRPVMTTPILVEET